jgi:beta-N-acetylhexosaminidase
MLDVVGLSLNDEDVQRLLHPNVGAVILFARNYQDRQQVGSLIEQIKQLRTPQLLIAVDQEGGRVQRFQHEFTRLPAAADFGDLWQQDKQTAPMQAYSSAYVMATELIEVGVDFSFAPVFDVTSKDSDVIGDRCFHPNPSAASELLGAYIDGMHAAGMVAIAKHFPGHGGVSGDSHHCLPIDGRGIDQIQDHDLLPYKELVDEIQGVMSAHVLFEQCSEEIPTYSNFWLQDILRQQLGFDGVVFSDDLTMQGAIDATEEPSIIESAQRAIYAGCDMVLVCNRPDLADELLAGLEFEPNEVLSGKLTRLAAK